MIETQIYPREEVEAAFAHYRAIVEGAHGSEAKDYSAYSGIFTEELLYVEHCMGNPEGTSCQSAAGDDAQGHRRMDGRI